MLSIKLVVMLQHILERNPRIMTQTPAYYSNVWRLRSNIKDRDSEILLKTTTTNRILDSTTLDEREGYFNHIRGVVRDSSDPA